MTQVRKAVGTTGKHRVYICLPEQENPTTAGRRSPTARQSV